MSNFFSLIKFVFAFSVALAAVFLVLTALPKSRLRAATLTVSGWILKLTALLCILYVISPLDLIPDAIPVAGFADDLVALVIGTASAIGGFFSAKAGLREKESMIEGSCRVLYEGEPEDP